MDAEQLKKLIKQGQEQEKQMLHNLGMIRGQMAAYQQLLALEQAKAMGKQNGNGAPVVEVTERAAT